MLKLAINDYIENQTAFFSFDKVSDFFTSKSVAEYFNIKRNTASHYLNQLHNEGVLIKINTRPVYFLHKKAFESQFYSVNKNTFNTLAELKLEEPFFYERKDLFSLLIGYKESLAKCIEQLKAAIYYPENGLPVLLTGESGTGKSFIVKIVHQFCVENDILAMDAPLVYFNCSQYANNPELLTSHLFGHKKGSFTGADEDKKGLFESAEGGILFLDEVHRLNSEGQEKLFTYLDQGVVQKMGESSEVKKMQVRLFFATTEELTSNFLTTFIRRIPIQIELPALEERTKNEKNALIYSFFLSEQRKIRRELHISSQVIHLLRNQSYIGNIGKLKNIIRVTVANAFLVEHKNKIIKVSIYNLPYEILVNAADDGTVWKDKKIVINEFTTLDSLITNQSNEQQRITRSYEQFLIKYEKNNYQLDGIEEELKKEVEKLFDFIVFETNKEVQQDLLVFIMQQVRGTLVQMENAYQITFNGNGIYAISYYLFQRNNVYWQPDDRKLLDMIESLKRKIKELFPVVARYSEILLQLLKPKLDLEISDMDFILLTLYLSNIGIAKEMSYARAVIVAHGYATASSIANVANRMLRKNLFESFDMPLDTTPQKIAEQILDYCEKNNTDNGLVILVDMGSLREIYEYFPKQITMPILIMNNVTTPMALSVGECIQNKIPLNKISEQVEKLVKFDYTMIYPKEKKEKIVLSTCYTGIGTAQQISRLLEKSLPDTINIRVLPYDYEFLVRHKDRDSIFSLYDVMGIVGTADPEIDSIPYVSLEELISGNGSPSLSEAMSKLMDEEQLRAFNEKLIRNFSLEKVINSVTILDTEKVMTEISLFMKRFEEIMDITIGNDKKLILYVHISCLIERLIRNEPIENYSGVEQCQEKALEGIKLAFSVIEKDYSVNIPKSEMGYIYDILFQKTDEITDPDDFE